MLNSQSYPLGLCFCICKQKDVFFPENYFFYYVINNDQILFIFVQFLEYFNI